MGSEKPVLDYAAILLDLEAKKAVLEQSIASIRAGLALGALGSSSDGIIPSNSSKVVGGIGAPVDLPTGAFLGKNVPAAIKLYLSAARAKKTNQEIAQALKDGGIETKQAKLLTLVTSALFRLKASGEVLRFKDGWGLTEWYPAGFRPMNGDAGPKKKTKKNHPKKKVAKAVTAPKKSSQKVQQSPLDAKLKDEPQAPQERVLLFMRNSSGKELTPSEIGQALGINRLAIQNWMGPLVRQGKVKNTAPGKYQIA